MGGGRTNLRGFTTPWQPTRALEARVARALIEVALDSAAGGRGAGAWPWSKTLSLWVDALITIEEREQEARRQDDETLESML
jgi:hypothetical protein